MERKGFKKRFTITVALVLVLTILTLFISACVKTTSTEAQAEDLNSEMSELNNMNQELNSLNISELNDSTLDDIEGII